MMELFLAVIALDANAVRERLRVPDVIQRLDGNDENVPPLVVAAARPNSEIVELLIRAGASPNVKDRHTGSTPLLHAVVHNNEANVRLLIGAGADTNVANKYGTNPLYAAQTPDVVAMLLAAHADPHLPGAEPCLNGSAVRGNVEAAKTIIAAGADPSAVGSMSGRTPLHHAAHNCNPEVLELLLAAGADALATDNKGKTPLRCIHSGTPQQRQAIIAALVAAGDRNWDHVPTPCAGLQRALVPTWKDSPNELSELFKRLKPEVQERARAALAVFHPHNVPVHLRIDLLSASLE
jgi:ankyrin repeat protein